MNDPPKSRLEVINEFKTNVEAGNPISLRVEYVLMFENVDEDLPFRSFRTKVK